MKQFTSHIDFSLTKKRFKMMIKQFSPFRSYSKKMLMLPVLLAVSMMFCTNSYDSSGFSYYNDIELSASVVNEKKSFAGSVLRFKGPDGNYYTGAQNYYSKESDKLAFSREYKDGYRIASTNYDENGEKSFRYEFKYSGDDLISRKKFNASGVLIEEWTSHIDDKNLGSIKEWHQNGQLKFETHFIGDFKYEGLMTLYNEQGEIIEQERYENGEMVEKIK